MTAAALRVEPIDHSQAEVAQRIHAVLMRASVVEAELLQNAQLPALAQTAAQLQATRAFYLGAWRGDELLGALGLGPDDEAGQIGITSLVVLPSHHRQGIASALVAQALQRAAGMVVSVTTAARNAPALALYRGCGFVDYRQGKLDDTDLLMIKLRRAPDSAG